ncbi:hypothetical protein T12_8459 [Trichinella patagoniensis]|uniref:Transmembrane protein n=1 Tax=Trichinella patagoniensis TaxID=990121 RepID=A0A0V1A6N9_9BILA|nr:hypothetical protein T12_8459 [Trichinella patagoniensis]
MINFANAVPSVSPFLLLFDFDFFLDFFFSFLDSSFPILSAAFFSVAALGSICGITFLVAATAGIELLPLVELANKVVDQCENNHNENRVS